MQDLRLAIRALVAGRVVSVAAILSLALGIGATTAIFSLVDSLLLRPLPVASPERLTTLSSDWAIDLGFKAGAGLNYEMWDRLRQRAGVFDGAFAWRPSRFSLGGGGVSQQVDGAYASGGFFSTLGVGAVRGRALTLADDVRGGGASGPVAVIGHGLWQRRFGGGDVIGTALTVDGVALTIVGVMPREFVGLEVGQTFDLVLPLEIEPLLRGQTSAVLQPRNYALFAMLRLKPGQSLAAGTAAVRALQPEVVSANAPQFVHEPFTLAPAGIGTSGASVTGGAGLRQKFTRPLLTLLAVVALVLVVACVNIANLLLARAAGRRHDLSVHAALGASRWRLARGLLVESLVLALLGAVLGLGLAVWGSRLFVSQLSTSINRVVVDQSVDWRVAFFAVATAAATALLFGVAPAVRATRAAPIEALKAAGRGPSGGSTPLTGALVVAQVAVSLVLVLAAGLLVRTFARLAALPVGFDRDRVLVVSVDTGRAHVDPAVRLDFFGRLADALANVPGVERAASSLWVPLGGGGGYFNVDVMGVPQLAERRVVVNIVTPRWFATYGTPIREGRDVDDRDTAAGPRVVVVNTAFARKFFPDHSAIGGVFRIGAFGPGGNRDITVVGVAADAVFRPGSMVPGLNSLPLREPVPPTIYLPMAQSAGIGPPDAVTVHVSVRSARGSPGALAPGIGAALGAVDGNLAYTFRPLSDYVSAALVQERVVAILSGFFGVLGLLLAGLGLYGVTSYGVSLRRTEIGIRLALGSDPGGVVRLVLSRVAWLVGLGIALGGGISLWASRFVASLLYGVAPRDPSTFALSATLLAALALLAGFLPARRASRIDPAIVLRTD